MDKPGTFTASPESSGMFYQWNRKIGWSATNPLVNSNGGTAWDATTPVGTEWSKATDPSPAGWRVPTRDEIKSLLNTDKVTNEWVTENGVNGRKFTDKTAGKSLFLPAIGFRDGSFGTLVNAGSYGYYWISTQGENGETSACYLCFGSGVAGWDIMKRYMNGYRGFV